MKGVIYSTSFFILIFVIFLNLSYFVHFENNRSLINNNFKKSLYQTGYILMDKENLIEEDVLETLISEVELSLPTEFDYEFQLLGFSEDPLLIRVKIICSSKKSNYVITLEETLLEKELENA